MVSVLVLLLLVYATSLTVGIAAPTHAPMHWMATIEMVWVHVSILGRHSRVAWMSMWMHHWRVEAWSSIRWRSRISVHIGRRNINGNYHIAALILRFASTPTTVLLLRVWMMTSVIQLIARRHVWVMMSWVVVCWMTVMRQVSGHSRVSWVMHTWIGSRCHSRRSHPVWWSHRWIHAVVGRPHVLV